jgi:PAS domain S-box-containing protein
MTSGIPAERLSLVVGAGRGESLIPQAFDLAADGLAVLDVSGPLARIVLANASLGSLLSVPAADLAGDPLQSWVHPASAAAAQAALETARAGGTATRIELGLVCAKGSQWWVQALVRRFEDGGADAALVLVTFTDLSDRKAIETAAGSLPLEMIGLDRDLRITWINTHALAGIGRPATALLGRHWFAVFPDLAPRLTIYQRVLAGESLDFDQVSFRTPCGESIAPGSSLRPILGRDGVVSGLLIMARDATDLRQAAVAQRHAERRLAVLVDKTQDVITVLSKSGVIEYQSAACQRLTGYSPAELLGRNVFELSHPDDVALLKERFNAQLVDSGRVVTSPAEARFRHKAGGWCWIEIVATNAFADPAVNGLVVVSRGIDRRKAAEAELAERRAQLDFSLDAARIGAWDYDVLTGVHRFDARCWHLIGGDARESTVTLAELRQLTHPDDLARSATEMLRHIKGETLWYEVEFRARNRDGDGDDWYWVYARGRATARAADGRVTRVRGVMMGINERRRAEIELHESERRLEAALWGRGVGFWRWDAGNPLLHVNDSWLGLTGFSRQEWDGLGLPWQSRVHPDDRARLEHQLQRLRSGDEESLEIEFRYQTRCGDWIWLLGRGRVSERDAEGRALRIFGTSVDITTQKKISEFLAETQAAASVGGWELNLRTQSLTWTSETYALFETTPCEYSPTLAQAFDLYDPACHADMQAAMGGAIEHGTPFDIEVRARTLKGRATWLRLIGKAERADGRTVRLYGAKQDITRLKAADQARREAIAVQHALTDSAPDWLILVDPQLRVQYTNRSLRGVSVEGVVGRNGLDLLDPSVRGLLAAACERALAQLRPQFAETYEQMPWGEWCHLEYSAAPVIEDGRAIGLSVRVTNATGRRHAEERLRTQARVLETMREGVVLFRPGGDIRLANPAAGRLFGLPVEALVGAPVSRLALSAEMLERIARLRPDHEHVHGATASSREWLAERGDGSQFLVEGVFSAVEFEGEPMIIGVLQDVTDRRQLERAIIETSTFEQQRIASDLHDGLGQELTGIALLLRSAAGRLPRDAGDGAALLHEATQLLESAVQSARALAHGLAPAALDPGGLPGALSDLAGRVRRTYGIRAQFRKHIEAPLHLDTTQANHLYRIAQEGVNNAVRHGRATFVTLRLSVDAQSVKVEIVDNGSGIPAPARRSAAGMGLRIMEYRAHMLGGELRIETPRRGGTAICCCVPVPPAG